MLDLYLRQYLLEKVDIAKANPDNPGEIGQYLEGFMEEYGLSEGDIDAIRSGEPERITPIFLRFDDAEAIEANLKAYQADNGLSNHDMEELWKNGQILRILPDYIHSDPRYYNRFVRLTVESLIRFISGKLVLRKSRQLRAYDFSNLSYQELKGAHNIFLGLSGGEAALAAVAGKYAGKSFHSMDGLAFDSLCEMINCINGLYASALSLENVSLEIALPGRSRDGIIRSNGVLYCLPAVVDGAEIDIIFSFDTVIRIEGQ